MDHTPNLALPYILAAQAQKHVTHNEAIRALDALTQISVLSRTQTASPVSPVEGARYILPTGATGVWAGLAGRIAAYQDGAWMFYTPRDGWIAWVAADAAAVVYSGGAWVAMTGAAATLGVNATADTTNRLTVSAAATLLNNEGSGHQLKINKAVAAATASMLYQTAFSGRAEMGTTGDDDFHIKVSADGATWREGVVISAATGRVTFPAGGVVATVSANVTIAVPGQAATIQAAFNQLLATRFEGSAQGIIVVADGTYALTAPLACRHPQSGRIVLRAATPAILPVEADFTGIKATDEAMLRAKYNVILDCTNVGGWTASDGEAIGLIQDIAFIRTGTTGTPVGIAASRQGGVVLDRCAVFGFHTNLQARENACAMAINCQLAHATGAGVLLQQGGFARVTSSLIATCAGRGIEVGQSQFSSDGGLRVKGAVTGALVLTMGSRGTISGANLSGNSGVCVQLLVGSTLEAANCTITGGAGQVALSVVDGSSVSLATVTASGDATQRTFQAQRGSVLSTTGAHVGTPVFSPAVGTTGNNGAWTF